MPEDLAAATVAAGGAFGNLGSAATMSPAFYRRGGNTSTYFVHGELVRGGGAAATQSGPNLFLPIGVARSFPSSKYRYGSNGRAHTTSRACCVDELSTKEQ